MGKYNGAVITTAGANVISQAISGTELTWTVMRSSSVAIPEGTDIAALTSLTGIEQTAAITDASVYGSNTIQVSARFSNTGVDTAYLLETIGIYGQLAGGSETLIAVMTAVTPDQMPVYDADSPSAFIYNSQITVQDAETVVMTVNDTGTATVADLNRKVNLNGGDLSDTKGETFTGSTASYPVISAGDTFKVMCGKIVKFCADIVKTFTKATTSTAGAKGLVPAPAAGEQIAYLRGDGTWKAPVFSKTTTATGLALDAREANPNVIGSLAADVKALNDSLTNLVTPVSLMSAQEGITITKNESFKIGNLIFVSIVFLSTNPSVVKDTALIWAPSSWQANAPLNLYDSFGQMIQGNCRVNNHYIRPGSAIPANSEYSIQGMYAEKIINS